MNTTIASSPIAAYSSLNLHRQCHSQDRLSPMLLSVEARDRFLGSSCGFCNRESGTGDVFLLQASSANHQLTSIIWNWYKRLSKAVVSWVLASPNLTKNNIEMTCIYRLCGLVARVPGYRSRGPFPGATTFSEKQWVWNGVHSAS
jgi:hypothetical protein